MKADGGIYVITHVETDRKYVGSAVSVRNRWRAHKYELLRAARCGKTMSLETRARMSAAKRGRPHSAEWRAAISAALSGKKKSPAHIAAMQAARINRAVARVLAP